MHRLRGYTVIEVMISLTILAIGATGVIAMQKVTTVANRDAKNLVVANQIARTWMERLRTDSVQWNHPSPEDTTSDIGTTLWLSQIGAKEGQWFRPVDSAVFGSPTFDALGNDVPDSQAADNGVFCTHVRLAWLYGPLPAQPPYLIRAEVRVFWLRDGGGGPVGGQGQSVCDQNQNPNTIDSATTTYHFVYAASAIRQNPT
jgi:prepilin-type N-terminal cleavage/methylation domain-containing protein